jgi:S-formylglutathione hydrolase
MQIPGISASLPGFYVDATQDPWSAHYRMYSYVTQNCRVLIGANFAADMTRQSIFGHSMGGHGALTLALRNPSQYRSVSAFAPISAPIHCPWGAEGLQRLPGPRPVALAQP